MQNSIIYYISYYISYYIFIAVIFLTQYKRYNIKLFEEIIIYGKLYGKKLYV